MTRKQFRVSLVDKLTAAGMKRVSKAKLTKTMKRTARYIRSEEDGFTTWKRKYLLFAETFYHSRIKK